MKKLSEGLGISLTELMEPVTVVKEEEAVYISARTVPVIELNDIDSQEDYDLAKKPIPSNLPCPQTGMPSI